METLTLSSLYRKSSLREVSTFLSTIGITISQLRKLKSIRFYDNFPKSLQVNKFSATLLQDNLCQNASRYHKISFPTISVDKNSILANFLTHADKTKLEEISFKFLKSKFSKKLKPFDENIYSEIIKHKNVRSFELLLNWISFETLVQIISILQNLERLETFKLKYYGNNLLYDDHKSDFQFYKSLSSIISLSNISIIQIHDNNISSDFKLSNNSLHVKLLNLTEFNLEFQRYFFQKNWLDNLEDLSLDIRKENIPKNQRNILIAMIRLIPNLKSFSLMNMVTLDGLLQFLEEGFPFNQNYQLAIPGNILEESLIKVQEFSSKNAEITIFNQDLKVSVKEKAVSVVPEKQAEPGLNQPEQIDFLPNQIQTNPSFKIDIIFVTDLENSNEVDEQDEQEEEEDEEDEDDEENGEDEEDDIEQLEESAE